MAGTASLLPRRNNPRGRHARLAERALPHFLEQDRARRIARHPADQIDQLCARSSLLRDCLATAAIGASASSGYFSTKRWA